MHQMRRAASAWHASMRPQHLAADNKLSANYGCDDIVNASMRPQHLAADNPQGAFVGGLFLPLQ